MYHPISFADREMFAYNKAYNERQTKLQIHYSYPENRIRYALEWYEDYKGDEEITVKAFAKALDWIAVCDDVEAHF